MDLRSLTSLKTSVIVGCVVLWNAGLGLGFYLNGGSGHLKAGPGLLAVAATCAASCGFACAVAFSRGIQDALLEDSRWDAFRPFDFLFVAGITGVLAVGLLAKA